MELLEGMPLNAILEKRGRLSALDTARLGLQIAAGLQYAHERRIVHRDIKTANLFFTRERVVKIMDFGLAKTIEEVRRSSTMIGGTPYYMAPEQAAGEAVDHRTDLYAFGVTLFRMVTGALPFVEGDLAYHHRHTPAPDPRELDASIPDAMAALLAKLLAKRPDDRCQSAAEVAAALQALLAAALSPRALQAPPDPLEFRACSARRSDSPSSSSPARRPPPAPPSGPFSTRMRSTSRSASRSARPTSMTCMRHGRDRRRRQERRRRARPGARAVGAGAGAAVGAVGGAITGNAGTGAAVGAATGGTLGLLSGLWGTRDHDPMYMAYVDTCLREKGYQPIGWK